MKAKHYFFLFLALFFPLIGFAEEAELPIGDFFTMVLEQVKVFGGLPWMGKVAAICFVLVGSMKVTFLRGLIWDRLGSAKAWVAPVLALIGGIMNMETITLPAILAYMGAGAGAIVLNQLLDLIKAMPGIGAFWIMVIDMIAKVTGGKTAEEVKAEKIDALQK